ncbi:hypothetical protein GALMADRAFT_460653 [Galerina marginata CBS 339.88]|uniref:DUF6533 domain-containing protein n=1 Tax=Galerina marginata (strain CBS 339.88) TaxID=685588 RepID=A0A067SYY7_GALM3|nr:hypothetical protein GALMADRAFT_460653 [Galerina marginata CBS 339.88]
MNPPLDGSLDEVQASYAVSLTWVACFVVLLYDTISKFPLEIDLIWRAPWTPVKVVYLYLRYMGLVQACVYATSESVNIPLSRVSLTRHFQPPQWFRFPSKCRLVFIFGLSIGSPMILISAVNGVMGLRLYALYGRTYKVLCFLSAIFLSETIIHLVTAVRIGIPLVKATYLAPPDIPILGCLTAPDSLKGAVLAW